METKTPLDLLVQSAENTMTDMSMDDFNAEDYFFPSFLTEDGNMKVKHYAENMIKINANSESDQDAFSDTDKTDDADDLKNENKNENMQESLLNHKEEEEEKKMFSSSESSQCEQMEKEKDVENVMEEEEESSGSMIEQEEQMEEVPDEEEEEEDSSEDQNETYKQAQILLLVTLYHDFLKTISEDMCSLIFPVLEIPNMNQQDVDEVCTVNIHKEDNLVLPPNIMSLEKVEEFLDMLKRDEYSMCVEKIADYRLDILYHYFDVDLTANVKKKGKEYEHVEGEQADSIESVVRDVFGDDAVECFDKVKSRKRLNKYDMCFDVHSSSFILFVRAMFFKTCSKYREKSFLKKNDDQMTGLKEITSSEKRGKPLKCDKHWMLQSCAGYDPWDVFFYSGCQGPLESDTTIQEETIDNPDVNVEQLKSFEGLYTIWDKLKSRVTCPKTGKLTHPIGRLLELFPHCYSVEICETKVPKDLFDHEEPPYCVISCKKMFPGEQCYVVNIQTSCIGKDKDENATLEVIYHPFMIQKDDNNNSCIALFQTMVKLMQYPTHIHYDIDKWLDDQKSFLPTNASPDLVAETLFQENHITRISNWYSDLIQLCAVLDIAINPNMY